MSIIPMHSIIQVSIIPLYLHTLFYGSKVLSTYIPVGLELLRSDRSPHDLAVGTVIQNFLDSNKILEENAKLTGLAMA